MNGLFGQWLYIPCQGRFCSVSINEDEEKPPLMGGSINLWKKSY